MIVKRNPELINKKERYGTIEKDVEKREEATA
jgi:hypothetical protein